MSLLPVKVVELVLPYPPRANRYWRVYQGVARPSALGLAYKKLVRGMVASKVKGVLTGQLSISLEVFRPRRAGDVDGHAKVLFDALQAKDEEGWPGLYLNDSQAVRITIEHWDHQPKRARVQVTVREDPNPRTPPRDWPITPAEARALAEAERQLAEITAKDNERAKARKAAREQPAQPPARSRAALSRLASPASYPARRK